MTKLNLIGLIGAGMTAAAGFALAQDAKTLTGAGASFPFPLYQEMFASYAKINGVQVNYQSVGSGAGQNQIIAQTVDFGASDAFMSDAKLKEAKAEILHIPMAIGSVVPTYNIPGLTSSLNFTGAVLAEIYLGKISKWNDKKIADLNKKVKLPDLAIQPVYRSDGSGTTSIFVDFLSKASSEWADKVSKGPQTTVKWPVGVGGPQNAGVAGLVKQTPGAIGYVEAIYAKANKLGYGLVRNASGKFVDGGDLKEMALASDSKPLPADTRGTFTNSDIGYPISGFTWVLVYKNQKYNNRSEAQGKAVVGLLKWMLSDGQKIHNQLGYAQIDGAALEKAKKIVASINYGGKAL
jgi:phosphate transport system substrate-binding protein